MKREIKATIITLRMIIRLDDGRDDDDDDSNDSNSYKSKACCSEVMYIIRYLFIGAEGGNIDKFPLLSITLRAFVVKQPYVAARSVYIVTVTVWLVADPSDRAVEGVGLRLLACWDCGFESRRRTWMFVCCECCVLSDRGLCEGPITRPEESYRVWCV
jgi:hypothetical protein